MTVNAKKRGRPKNSKNSLTQISIIERAKTLMEEDKKIPSIRKLSSSLDVDPMAIYYYFSNKTALLEAITCSLIESVYNPTSSECWKLELEKLCFSYLALLEKYNGLLETMLSMPSSGPATTFISRFNTIIDGRLLKQENKVSALCLLVDYLHGFSLAMQHAKEPNVLVLESAREPIQFYISAIDQQV